MTPNSDKPINSEEISEWECFRDLAYYDMWCVRKVGERRFEYGFHVSSEGEAKALIEELESKSPINSVSPASTKETACSKK